MRALLRRVWPPVPPYPGHGCSATELSRWWADQSSARNVRSCTLAAIVVIVGLAGLLYVAAAHGAGATPQTTAPGGKITAVVQATARDGWPHPPTTEETHAIADLAIWRASIAAAPGERSAIVCRFGAYMGRARCGVATYAGKRRTSAYRLNVMVRRDGTYIINRAARGGGGAP